MSTVWFFWITSPGFKPEMENGSKRSTTIGNFRFPQGISIGPKCMCTWSKTVFWFARLQCTPWNILNWITKYGRKRTSKNVVCHLSPNCAKESETGNLPPNREYVQWFYIMDTQDTVSNLQPHAIMQNWKRFDLTIWYLNCIFKTGNGTWIKESNNESWNSSHWESKKGRGCSATQEEEPRRWVKFCPSFIRSLADFLSFALCLDEPHTRGPHLPYR